MTRTLVALLILPLGLIGCSAQHLPEPAPAPWLRAQPGRCLLQRDLREGMDQMARHCAERFVAENGYTELPATGDTTRLVAEPEEQGDWEEILGRRRGRLLGTATSMACSLRECRVFFRILTNRTDCEYRAVTMTQVFNRMRLVPGIIRNIHCAINLS